MGKRNKAAHHYDRGSRSSWSYKLGHIQVKNSWEQLLKPMINLSTLPIYRQVCIIVYLFEDFSSEMGKRNEATHHYDKGSRSSWSYKLGHIQVKKPWEQLLKPIIKLSTLSIYRQLYVYLFEDFYSKVGW